MDDKTIARRLREARRKLGLTQAELAMKSGCQQSAISMMERGTPGVLAEDKLRQIANLLQVDLSATPAPRPEPAALTHGYCPVCDCPSNLPYVVNGDLLYVPVTASRPADGLLRHCPWCGELLQTACPNPECGAPARSGSCCGSCGTPFVSGAPQLAPDGLAAWADAQRARVIELHHLARPR